MSPNEQTTPKASQGCAGMDTTRARPGLPRFVEVALALVGLAVTSPILVGCSALVALGSKGPVLFRQQRVGKHGTPFEMLKFRTMDSENQTGPKITAGGDPRVTPVGRLLRRTKLDELPELWNIVRGDMSFVGPRPEVADFVALEHIRWQAVLAARPGLTDPVTIELRDEEALLERLPQAERLAFYREHLVPYKLAKQAEYLSRRTAWSDLRVLARTVLTVIWPSNSCAPTLEQVRAIGWQQDSRQRGSVGPQVLS